MAEKQECPGCRKPTNELHIRPNPGIEEVVAAWKLSRPYILYLSKEDERRRSSHLDDSPLEIPNPKKRKNASEVRRIGKLRDSTPSSPLKKPAGQRKLSPEDDDLAMMTIPTCDVDASEIGPSSNLNDTRPDDLVPCPMCYKNVKFKNINRHIDNVCDSPADTTRSNEWAKIMGNEKKCKQKESDDVPDERLPKVSYGTLKDKKLKEMLAEHSLETHGDRNLLIQRHQRWVMLCNANLDRSSRTRKSKTELKKELNKWEEEKTKRKKNMVEDEVAHEKIYKREFDELVKAARGRKDRNSTTSPELSMRSTEIDKKPSPIRSSPNDDTIVVDSEEEREGYR